ncbi:putative Vesicle-associated membrane protein [Zostera marina]|uniref:Putative Vesicle-associated membrane protein n=1 Tax=Zostera marina TaxID=29655 RepID=A0A0K9Q359_ZOSMR|nr:putative Vesicle-associated membrane protein [Zostera marina]
MEGGGLFLFYLHNSEKDELSCVMQLSNITSHNVAYKVKTTAPRKYCVRPKREIILPGSTCDVTVLMQASKQIISDYNCKDKFLIQCVVAEHGATFEDITDDMFTEESRRVFEEFEFNVVCVPNTPPSPVPENPEEAALSTLSSTSENIGSKNP